MKTRYEIYAWDDVNGLPIAHRIVKSKWKLIKTLWHYIRIGKSVRIDKRGIIGR